MKPEVRSAKQAELEKHDPNLYGKIQEEKLYNNLRGCLENQNVKNTVVISGWEDNGGKNRVQKEFDFVVVSQPSQTIIHIEVKQTNSEERIKDAAKQLETGLKMFQEMIPFPEKESWKYVQVMYFEFEEEISQEVKINKKEEKEQSSKHRKSKTYVEFQNKFKCSKCQKFIIGPKTDLKKWWKEIGECTPQDTTKPIQEHSRETYLNVLRFLLHQMYAQKDCATTSQLVGLTHQISDKICNPDKIMFWSKEQYKTLKDFKDKKVALTSGFGTGKTILLRAKAKEMILSGHKVVIIIFETTAEKTILRSEYEKLFEQQQSLVKVTCISGAKGNY